MRSVLQKGGIILHELGVVYSSQLARYHVDLSAEVCSVLQKGETGVLQDVCQIRFNPGIHQPGNPNYRSSCKRADDSYRVSCKALSGSGAESPIPRPTYIAMLHLVTVTFMTDMVPYISHNVYISSSPDHMHYEIVYCIHYFMLVHWTQFH